MLGIPQLSQSRVRLCRPATALHIGLLDINVLTDSICCACQSF